jgi:hypothetical protein
MFMNYIFNTSEKEIGASFNGDNTTVDRMKDYSMLQCSYEENLSSRLGSLEDGSEEATVIEFLLCLVQLSTETFLCIDFGKSRIE